MSTIPSGAFLACTPELRDSTDLRIFLLFFVATADLSSAKRTKVGLPSSQLFKRPRDSTEDTTMQVQDSSPALDEDAVKQPRTSRSSLNHGEESPDDKEQSSGSGSDELNESEAIDEREALKNATVLSAVSFYNKPAKSSKLAGGSRRASDSTTGSSDASGEDDDMVLDAPLAEDVTATSIALSPPLNPLASTSADLLPEYNGAPSNPKSRVASEAPSNGGSSTVGEFEPAIRPIKRKVGRPPGVSNAKKIPPLAAAKKAAAKKRQREGRTLSPNLEGEKFFSDQAD
ncbi:hypothetical protein P7C70_g4081, partial [Phenoliferia sp. Uapishka_3]